MPKITINETWLDYPNKSDLATIVYISGCPHGCTECHSPEMQKIVHGDIDIFHFIDKINENMYRNKTDKLVISGGDPLFSENILTTITIMDNVIDCSICIYTGYEFLEIPPIIFNNSRLKYVKCGKFDKNLKQLSEKTDEYIRLASSNQCIIKIEDNIAKIVSEKGVYKF
jgi:anaerobic ribonucleoside-triphosphate reductase activating protein